MKMALLLDFGLSSTKEMNNKELKTFCTRVLQIFLNIHCVPRLIHELTHDDSAKSKKEYKYMPRLFSLGECHSGMGEDKSSFAILTKKEFQMALENSGPRSQDVKYMVALIFLSSTSVYEKLGGSVVLFDPWLWLARQNRVQADHHRRHIAPLLFATHHNQFSFHQVMENRDFSK
jgi:hypothetical protein